MCCYDSGCAATRLSNTVVKLIYKGASLDIKDGFGWAPSDPHLPIAYSASHCTPFLPPTSWILNRHVPPRPTRSASGVDFACAALRRTALMEAARNGHAQVPLSA